MSVLSETVISSEQAASIAHVSANTILNWAKKGCKGVKLEAVFVGQYLKTSKEALTRFIEVTNAKRQGA